MKTVSSENLARFKAKCDETYQKKGEGGAKTYTASLTSSSWSGSAGNYTYSISAATHGCGTTPSVHTYVNNEETYDSPTIDSSGNITLHSNAKVAMRVVVKQ